MRKSLPEKGLTLIEMIVAIAIMSLLVVVVFFLMTSSAKTWQAHSKAVSLEDQLRSIQDVMVRDLRPCNWVFQKQESVSVTRLYFSRSGTIPTTNSSTYFEYDSSSHMLYRALSGVKNPLSEPNLTATITYTTITPSVMLVEVGMTAQEGLVQKTNSFAVTLRNFR
jgi:prepilin-type N-terminal cleavage/methylation domain-containing protein